MKLIVVSMLYLLASGCSGNHGLSTTGYGRQPQIIGDESFRADTMRALARLESDDYKYLSGIHKGHEPTCKTQSERRGYRVDGYYDSDGGQAGICRSGRRSIDRMAEIIKHESDCHGRFEWEGKGINSDHTQEC